MDGRKHGRTRFIYCLRVHGIAEGVEFRGHLVDVTPAGMLLVGDVSLDQGTSLLLKVDLPRNVLGNGHMMFGASVRWCNSSGVPGQYYLGVFLDFIPQESSRLFQILMDGFQELRLEGGRDRSVWDWGEGLPRR